MKNRHEKTVMLAILLAASGGLAEINQPAADLKHQAFCPRCGFSEAGTAGPATEVHSATNTWKSSVYGGFSAQSGNTTASSYNYGGDFEKKSALYRGKLKVDGKRGEAEDKVTVSKTEASGELRRMFDERWFSYGVLSALHDGIKEISYRVKAGPGFGYYFVDTQDLSVDVSTGPLYIQEKTSGTESGYLAWRAAQGMSWQITDTFRWWSSVELVASAQETSSYSVTVKTGVDTKINNRLSLVVSLEDDYDSMPEAKAAIKKNDLTISTGIRYAF